MFTIFPHCSYSPLSRFFFFGWNKDQILQHSSCVWFSINYFSTWGLWFLFFFFRYCHFCNYLWTCWGFNMTSFKLSMSFLLHFDGFPSDFFLLDIRFLILHFVLNFNVWITSFAWKRNFYLKLLCKNRNWWDIFLPEFQWNMTDMKNYFPNCVSQHNPSCFMWFQLWVT